MAKKVLSKQEMVLEYTKCILDPIHFAETYCEVFDMTQNRSTQFLLFDKQKDLLHAYKDHRFNIVLKPRQAGVSTTTALYIAHHIMFSPDRKVLVLANKRETAQEFLKKVKSFINSAPEWMANMYGKKLEDSKSVVALGNGSMIKAVACSKDALRSYTPTFLVMDEAAFIDDGADVWTAALPALSTGGGGCLISTPNGLDELYYRTFDAAKNRRNAFNIVELKWYEDPRFNKDLKWIKGDSIIETKDHKIYIELVKQGYKPSSTWFVSMCNELNNDPRKISQELEGGFLGSGMNFIDEKYIQAQENQNVMLPIRTEGFDGGVWIWEDPIEGHQYILGADVSTGSGSDYSTINVVDVDTGRQVMEYQGKIPPDVLGTLINEYGNRYNALSAIDVTGGVGIATIIKLIEANYDKLYYSEIKSKPLKDRLTKYQKNNGQDLLPGFLIGSNRPLILQEFERQVRMDELIIRSSRLISELKTFIIKDNNRPDHKKGFHDDLIFSVAIGLYVVQFAFKNLKKAEETTIAMLNSWLSTSTIINKEIEDGTIIPDNEVKRHDPPNTGNPYIDNSWLFRF